MNEIQIKNLEANADMIISAANSSPCECAGSVKLISGHIYRAKRPRCVGIVKPLYNDREILHLGIDTVQYDSPSVAFGRKYPTVSRAKFEKWAGKDVTDELREGDWAPFSPNAGGEGRP